MTGSWYWENRKFEDVIYATWGWEGKNQIPVETSDGESFKSIKLMNSEIKIFSCGPSVMMESLKDFSNENNIDCDLALETVMACGFGICQGCTVEYSNGELENPSYRSKYGLVCM